MGKVDGFVTWFPALCHQTGIQSCQRPEQARAMRAEGAMPQEASIKDLSSAPSRAHSPGAGTVGKRADRGLLAGA